MNGWIKVHRALAEHHVASDPHSLSVWIHMLMLANHRESKRQINGRVLVIMPGQLITSRKSLADKTGVNESKVERVLKMLQSEQLIEQHGTSKFRVISIVNWAKYQTDEQQDEQQVNSKRTAGEQQMNTPEEIPNGIKNEKKEKKTPSPPDERGSDESFERFWRLYPKKVSKKDALKAWGKIKPDKHESIMRGLAKHRDCDQWVKDEGQFIPNAATWLNAERWEDEVRPYVAGANRQTGGASRPSLSEQVRQRAAEREAERARQEGHGSSEPGYLQDPGQGGFDLDGEFARIG